MNTAISSTGFEDYCMPANGALAPLRPIPRIDELEDDILLFRVLDELDSLDDLPVPSPLPEKRRTVLDVESMVVSASLIRRIEHELKHDECDPRTVFSSCRGLAKGSLEFEDAYVAARIRSFAKHQRVITDPFLVTQPKTGNPLENYFQNFQANPTVAPHPMAVIHPGHLMSHLGIWVIALLGAQVWAAMRISAFADTYLLGGRTFYFAMALFVMLALDSFVWFRRRGSLCDAFFVPGIVLFLMALLPAFILHVRGILMAM